MSHCQSYRESLVQAITAWFPSQCFARRKLRKGLCWTPYRLFWMTVLMAWHVEQTLTDRFAAVRDLLAGLFPSWRLGTSYSGYVQALLALTPWLRDQAAARLRRLTDQRAGCHRQRLGWCAFAADGSRFDCPRTAANEARLGCAGKKRTAPQLYLTTLWHMGTGLPWDFRVGPGTASEREHLRQMLPALPAGSLVVADAGFVGYELCAALAAAGHSFLIRVGSNVHLLQELGFAVVEHDDTVYLWPDAARDRPPLVLRLIVLARGKKKMYLLTDVTDAARLPAQTAAVLYQMRWGVEVFYRSCKQTLARRKMRSGTPEAAEAELTWAVLGLWLLGAMSVAGIVERGGDPLSWSVALARKHAQQAMRRAQGERACPQGLLGQLAFATRDDYKRSGSKKARNWPHKKRPKPPGRPKIALATQEQVLLAQQFLEEKVPA